jgi:hypothetical protein
MGLHKKKDYRELDMLLREAQSLGFTLTAKKSGSILLKTKNKKDCYLIHPGSKALKPVEKFIKKHAKTK